MWSYGRFAKLTVFRGSRSTALPSASSMISMIAGSSAPAALALARTCSGRRNCVGGARKYHRPHGSIVGQRGGPSGVQHEVAHAVVGGQGDAGAIVCVYGHDPARLRGIAGAGDWR